MQCGIWFNKKGKNDKRRVLGPCVTNLENLPVCKLQKNYLIMCRNNFLTKMSYYSHSCWNNEMRCLGITHKYIKIWIYKYVRIVLQKIVWKCFLKQRSWQVFFSALLGLHEEGSTTLQPLAFVVSTWNVDARHQTIAFTTVVDGYWDDFVFTVRTRLLLRQREHLPRF